MIYLVMKVLRGQMKSRLHPKQRRALLSAVKLKSRGGACARRSLWTSCTCSSAASRAATICRCLSATSSPRLWSCPRLRLRSGFRTGGPSGRKSKRGESWRSYTTVPRSHRWSYRPRCHSVPPPATGRVQCISTQHETFWPLIPHLRSSEAGLDSQTSWFLFNDSLNWFFLSFFVFFCCFFVLKDWREKIQIWCFGNLFVPFNFSLITYFIVRHVPG